MNREEIIEELKKYMCFDHSHTINIQTHSFALSPSMCLQAYENYCKNMSTENLKEQLEYAKANELNECYIELSKILKRMDNYGFKLVDVEGKILDAISGFDGVNDKICIHNRRDYVHKRIIIKE